MWPCGSSGAPHRGHGGRPDATIRVARATNERAASARHPDAQQVGAVLVLVVVIVGVDRFAVLGLGAGLDEDPLVVHVPAERQRAGPERLVDRLVERPRVVDDRGGIGGRGFDAAPLELGEEVAEPVGQHGDLDLLEHDADTTRGPSRAWRKNVRSPGRPIVPATKRSGGSKR